MPANLLLISLSWVGAPLGGGRSLTGMGGAHVKRVWLDASGAGLNVLCAACGAVALLGVSAVCVGSQDKAGK